MRPADEIENVVKKMSFKAGPEMGQQIWAAASRAQEKSQDKSPVQNRLILRRIAMNTRMVRFAAAAAIIIIAALIGIYLFGGSIDGTSVAWADVVRQMQQARTVSWTETEEVAPPKDKNTFLTTGGYVRRCFYKAPGRERLQSTYFPPKVLPPMKRSKELADALTREFRDIQIRDRNVGKLLLLNPQEMTGEIHTFDPASAPDRTYDLFFNPTSTMTPEAESLGSRQMDGHETVGFRILKKGDGTDIWSGDKTEIWVDVKTKRVVRLETGATDGGWKFVLKDFVFDEPLDDSLFTLELPQGYKEKSPGRVSSTTP